MEGVITMGFFTLLAASWLGVFAALIHRKTRGRRR